jgi:hypothetical protein
MKSVELEKILSAGREQDSSEREAVIHAKNGLGAQMMHAEVIAPDVGRALVVIRSVSETFQETTCVGPESIAAGYTAGHAGTNTRMKSKMQQRNTMRVVREAGAQVASVWSRLILHVLTSIKSSSDRTERTWQ